VEETLQPFGFNFHHVIESGFMGFYILTILFC